jgi:hypothetical protein
MRNSVKTTIVVLILAILAPAVLLAGPFQLWVTVSPPGPQNADPASWGGILRYRFSTAGAPAVVLAEIDRSLVADPCGLVFRTASHELFVGNRHGNTGGGSISGFTYDAASDSFEPSGTITGNGLNGVHQLALDPVTGELFAANYGGGVSRFLFDASGTAVPNGVVGGSQWTRGVAVSLDGQWLYVTGATPVIRRFDLATGSELPNLTVTGATSLHFLRLVGGNALYAADPVTSMVYRLVVAPDGTLSEQTDIPAPSAASETVSPDQMELFATGHLTSHQITRLLWNEQDATWDPETPIYPGVPMGDILAMAVADMIDVPDADHSAAMLLPNRPNPFNPRTVIPFRLESPAMVELAVYDANGRFVRTLVSQDVAAGNHEIPWDGCDEVGRAVASGVYTVRLTAGAQTQLRSLVMVR